MIKVLVLGVSGMLGHVLYKEICRNHDFEARGTTRCKEKIARFFTQTELGNIYDNIDANGLDELRRIVENFAPDVVINCIGVIRQTTHISNTLQMIAVNALFPHQLGVLCRETKSRLIHISTDCVFDGKRGSYRESDAVNPQCLYGRSKLLGEIIDADASHVVTLRTSIIGHELLKQDSLVDWFLSQSTPVDGYTKVIYTGLTTIEMHNVIVSFVLPNTKLSGIYHVSSEPISKYDLLAYIARKYHKIQVINPDDEINLDRSLNSEAFRSQTGYCPPKWENMVSAMHQHFVNASYYCDKHCLIQ